MHAIKWKLEESEGMASAKIIINIISILMSMVYLPGQARPGSATRGPTLV